MQLRNIVSDMWHDPGQFLAFVWSGWTTTWPTELLGLIWIAWLISWVVASFWSGRTEKHAMSWKREPTAFLFSQAAFYLRRGLHRWWARSRSGISAAAALTSLR